MDYYDFFGGIKQVISQDQDSRLILVKYKKLLVVIDEWYSVIDKKYHERGRMRLEKEQIKHLAEMV